MKSIFKVGSKLSDSIDIPFVAVCLRQRGNKPNSSLFLAKGQRGRIKSKG